MSERKGLGDEIEQTKYPDLLITSIIERRRKYRKDEKTNMYMITLIQVFLIAILTSPNIEGLIMERLQ